MKSEEPLRIIVSDIRKDDPTLDCNKLAASYTGAGANVFGIREERAGKPITIMAVEKLSAVQVIAILQDFLSQSSKASSAESYILKTNIEKQAVSTKAISIHEDGDLVFEDDAKTILYACKPTTTKVVIPETVKKINPEAFAECKELTSVTIGLGTKSVKTITRKLFQHCKNLTHIVLWDSVTAIGVQAFEVDGWHDTGNPNLQSITIPASVKRIGSHAFYYCNKLSEVHIADVAAWCNIEFDGEGSNPIGYAHHLFLGDTEIRDLVIPEGVTVIQNGLFAGCADFTSVTIPDTVTAIGAEAFKGCTGLKTVAIPGSVTKIGKDAFDGIVNLVYHGSAKWDNGNLWWGARCLNGYMDGNLVYDSERKKALHGYLKSDIGDVVLPDGVTKIGDRAFQGCSGLTSVVIPNGVKEIGERAFEGCSALKFITIPDGVKEFAYATFRGCTNLSSITIPDSMKSWDYEVFRGCANLQMVRMPEGVEGIESWTFGGCARLKEITIPKSVKYFNDWAFHSCAGLETMIFQGPVRMCYWCIYGCNNLKHVFIPKGTKEHFLKQNEGTDLGIKNFVKLLEEEGSNVAEQQQEVMPLLTMAQGFDKGIGVPQNGEMAISLYKQAAEKGSPEAAYRLGVCYRDGEYVPQDNATALTYFRQAAESKYKDSDEQTAKLQN